MKLLHNDGTVSLSEVNSRLDNDLTREIIASIADKGYMDVEEIESRIVDTGSAMTGGKYSVKEYMRAMEFTSYRLGGDSQVASYKKTFPDRILGKTDGAVMGKASIYANGKLPIQLLSMSQVPLDLLYMRETHKSIRKLSELVEFGETERIQMESADKLLTHIAPNKTIKIEHDVADSTAEALSSLSDSLNSIADMAMTKLNSGSIDAKTLIQR